MKNNANNKVEVTKVPFSQENEEAFLSCLLKSEDLNDVKIEELILNITEKDFYIRENKILFKAIKNIVDKDIYSNIPVTILLDQIKENGDNNKVNIDYINKLVTNDIAVIYADHYKNKLIDYSTSREVIENACDIVNEANGTKTHSQLVAYVQDKFSLIGKNRHLSDNLVHISDAISSYMKDREDAQIRGFQKEYKSGIKKLDKVIKGFKPGQLVIVAARPGCGKTAFALSVACQSIPEKDYDIDDSRKKVVLIFNQEMTKEELIQRIIANKASTDMGKLSDLLLNDQETNQDILKVNKMVQRSKVFIDDTPGITIEEIMTKCKRIHDKEGRVDLVIVDYLQLLNPSVGKRFHSRQEEVANLSRQMKLLAKTVNAPVMVLSQLSREIDKRDNNENIYGKEVIKAKLSDLRDSGAIEQDADIVLFLQNLKSKEEEEINTGQKDVLLSIAKHRNGGLDDITLNFIAKQMRFEEYKSKREITAKIHESIEEREKNN